MGRVARVRAQAPTTSVTATHLVVSTALTATDGTELAPLEVSVPRRLADHLDPTATPGVAALVAASVLRGEHLEVTGPVDRVAAEGAEALAGALAAEWGTRPIRVDVVSTYEGGDRSGGVGLLFDRGVDSWSTLLDRLDDPAAERVTHLLAVHPGPLPFGATDAAILDGHQRVADELGLELIVATTSARTLLDAHRPWSDTAGPVLVATGLAVAAGLRRLVLTSRAGAPEHAEGRLDQMLGTGRTEVALGNTSRDRAARVAHVRLHPLARRSLQVCDQAEGSGSCGRCMPCQATMALLLLAGDPGPEAGFDHPIDPALVRTLALPDAAAPTVDAIRRSMPAEHEDLRRAWSDAWSTSHDEEPPARWGAHGPPALAGPSTATRVAAGLRAATGQADHPAPVPLGWRTGTVALRPALADHQLIRYRAGQGPDRARPWAVVEPQVRDGQRDGTQAGLALRCLDAFGPGPCYIPGIPWADDDRPVLGPQAVAALLRTVRARLWWRDVGDLDPLRLVETVELGCLPLQVMPPGAARDLANALPPALSGLVLSEDDLATLDLSPAAVRQRLHPAVDHILAGSADRDLVVGAYS